MLFRSPWDEAFYVIRGEIAFGIDGREMLAAPGTRSEEHTSELQSLMRNSYAVFCLKKKNTDPETYTQISTTHIVVTHVKDASSQDHIHSVLLYVKQHKQLSICIN